MEITKSFFVLFAEIVIRTFKNCVKYLDYAGIKSSSFYWNLLPVTLPNNFEDQVCKPIPFLHTGFCNNYLTPTSF